MEDFDEETFVENNESQSVTQHSVETTNEVNEDIYVDSYKYTSLDGEEYWILKCDKKFKPLVNQIFPDVEAAFVFYIEYSKQCRFVVRRSSAKYRGTLLTHKYIQCSSARSPEERTIKRRRTNSRRCECEAKIILKNGPNGCFIGIFVEKHNHAVASVTGRQFLRYNRKVTLFHQNFNFDHRKVNIGSVKSPGILKKMVGSYENIGATTTDFKNLDRDVRARIGKHDADIILDKLRLKREGSNNTFFYEYKVDTDGSLIGLFWADAIGRRNYSVFGYTLSFDPTFRTNKYVFYLYKNSDAELLL